MAVPANTVLVSSRTNVKPDVSEIIAMISPTDTPVQTMAKKRSATAKYVETLSDSLPVAATNKHIEGDDDAATAEPAVVRTANRTQIIKSVVSVSGTAEQGANYYGYASQMAYAMAKRAKATKRDLEFAISQNQPSAADATNGDTMAGLESSIATNIVYANTKQTGTTTPGFANGDTVAPTDPTNAAVAFSETMLKSLVKSVWEQGGEADMLVVGPVAKQAASAFSGIASLYRDGNGNAPASIQAAADLYVSDFGEINIIPSRFNRPQNCLLLDSEYMSLYSLRDWRTYDLAKTGDNEKKTLLWEGCILVEEEKAMGKIVNVTS